VAVELRRIEPGEEEAFERSVRVPFLAPVAGDAEAEAEIRRGASHLDAGRAWVVDDGGAFVGNCSIDNLDVSIPAGPGLPCPILPMAGITSVGVYPTHRRRGLLRQMMSAMIADARDRGEPLAGLVASESSIYRRFGFGQATERVTLSIDTSRSAFVVPASPVEVRLVDPEASRATLVAMYERTRPDRPGEIGRSPQVWDAILADPPNRRGGGQAAFVAVSERGYLRYRAHPGSMLEGRPGRVVLEELRAETPEVEAALWRYVLDLDLVGLVDAPRRPVDERLRWRLADPRQLRVVSSEDLLHVKVLDVGAAMQARGYLTSGRLVFEVTPPPGASPEDETPAGRWVLEADGGAATCRPARRGEAAELAIDAAALGSVYMGGYPVTSMVAAGRAGEMEPGAARLADALLCTRPAPLTTTGF